MTKTITSETDSRKHYFLTIDDETSQAVDCSCPDRIYRHRQCKHMRALDTEVQRAMTFAALFAKYDARANGQAVSQRIYFEMALGY